MRVPMCVRVRVRTIQEEDNYTGHERLFLLRPVPFPLVSIFVCVRCADLPQWPIADACLSGPPSAGLPTYDRRGESGRAGPGLSRGPPSGPAPPGGRTAPGGAPVVT